MEERYIATFMLHALADIIGFKNGDWEFNNAKKNITMDTTLEILYEFIGLGGINDIDISKWIVSDDTIMHTSLGHAILTSDDKYDKKMIDNIKNELIGAYSLITFDFENGIDRKIGYATKKYISLMMLKNINASMMPYDKNTGGNGVAMRNSCIGLAYFGVDNRELLYTVAIESGRLTHNSPHGYLAGLTSALFTAYAIENIEIELWPHMLVKVLESAEISKFIKDDIDEKNDHDIFIQYWKKYIDLRFDDDKPITTRAQNNLVFRSRFHYENFTINTVAKVIGESGFSAVIMAYDALLDARDCWEKLIIYSALHFGDGDTVGAIAGSWYGALYGFNNMPKKHLNQIEKMFKDITHMLGVEFYKKYYIKSSK